MEEVKTIGEAINRTQKKIIEAIETSGLDASIIKLIIKDIYNQVLSVEASFKEAHNE